MLHKSCNLHDLRSHALTPANINVQIEEVICGNLIIHLGRMINLLQSRLGVNILSLFRRLPGIRVLEGC